MKNYTTWLFTLLTEAGQPNDAQRQAIYQQCRHEVAAAFADAEEQRKQLDKLEKVIRRQEMQALYEATLQPKP